MCLAIPAQIVEIVDADARLAIAEISGVRRKVSIALLDGDPEPVQIGAWVLIHVGFALARIDEDEARETLDLLAKMGEAYEQELADLREGTVA
jgi:hydrogenase expression/formation protein HypC